MANLIAYYTYSPESSTKKAALAIQSSQGGDLFEIEPVDAYPSEMQACIAQAKEEIEKGYRPPIKLSTDMAPYDTLFIGSPNWCGTIAPPASTFLASLELAGKKIIPFMTFGGSGMGNAVADIKALVPEAEVANGIGIKASDLAQATQLIEEALGAEQA